MTVEELPGNAIYLDRLRLRTQRAADTGPAFLAVATAFHEMERMKFNAEGAWPPGSQSWEPLSPNTIAKKMRSGSSNPFQPLVDTGVMQASLIGSGGGYTLISYEFMEVGTAVVDERGRNYPPYHQQGTDNMPQRMIVEITPPIAELFALIIMSYLGGGEGYLAIAAEGGGI